jgi:predicted aspartyl protease
MRLLSVIVVAGCQCLLGGEGQGEGQKVTLRQGFPFVDVSINGRGPFRMLVDTGADASLLTPQAAHKAGLKLDHRVILTTMAGEKIVPGGSQNVIAIGGVQEAGLAILTLDLPEVRSLTADADGVLGQSFLNRNAYMLDYRQKRLWLGEDATAQAGRLPNAVTAVHSRGRTVLPVSLDSEGRTWQLALDSGSTSLVVDCSERCPRAWDIERDSRLITHTGDRAVLRGTLRQVQLGDLPMASAEAVLLESVAAAGGWDDGVLPTRWFSAFYVNGGVVRFAPR